MTLQFAYSRKSGIYIPKDVFKKNIYTYFLIDFREEERGNGVIPHPSGSLSESLRDSGGQGPGRGGSWPGVVGPCPLPVEGGRLAGSGEMRSPGLLGWEGVLARLGVSLGRGGLRLNGEWVVLWVLRR